MGVYIVTKEEFKGEFEKFLRDFEGDVGAKVIAESWNELAKEYGWDDGLVVKHRRIKRGKTKRNS